MKQFTVNKNDAGMRLDKFITKTCPLLPASLMYKAIRQKDIKINSKRAKIDTRICEGDIISVYAKDEFLEQKEKQYDFLSASDNLKIVYEDEFILLADKPQGLLVHPDKNEYGDTLIARIQKYLYKKGEYKPEVENCFKPALANRIDRNTGGIVIAAKTAEALRIICEKIKLREIDKRYLAVVHGSFSEKSGVLTGFLEKNEDKNKVYLQSKKTETNKSITTAYKTLCQKNGLSLLEVHLITGRTHQIRAHMAANGHALLGDGKYGKLSADKKMGFNKQALYSYKLTFTFESDAGELNYLNGKTFCVSEVWFAKELFGYEV